MGLAGPKVEAVSVASGSCGCAQRGGQVVNFGVRAGRIGMVLEAAVDDSAGCPARERSGQRGGCVLAADHVPVSGGRSSLWAEHERGAQLGGRSATSKRGGDAPARDEPAGRHHWQGVVNGGVPQPEEREGTNVPKACVIE